MDTEIVAAIDRVNDRIDALEIRLRGEFRQGLSELREEVHDSRAELRAELADVRRQAVMLNESTRDDIRLVAEAVAVLTVKVDSLRQ